MHSPTVSPSPALADFVECYGLWEDGAPPGPGLLPGPPGVLPGPDGRPGSSCEAPRLAGDAPRVGAPGVVAWQRLCLRGRAGGLNICFRPAGFFHLFGVPMLGVAGAAPVLGGAAGPFARELARCVRGAATGAERLAAADELLLRQLHRRHSTPGAIDAVANCILRRHGQVNIEALALGAGLSRRQLERRFLAEVGTPPKLYARIIRFTHVLKLLAASPAPDWQDVAYLCGYYDQAHFIREFRCFTGQTPAAYLLQDNGLPLLFLAR